MRDRLLQPITNRGAPPSNRIKLASQSPLLGFCRPQICPIPLLLVFGANNWQVVIPSGTARPIVAHIVFCPLFELPTVHQMKASLPFMCLTRPALNEVASLLGLESHFPPTAPAICHFYPNRSSCIWPLQRLLFRISSQLSQLIAD